MKKFLTIALALVASSALAALGYGADALVHAVGGVWGVLDAVLTAGPHSGGLFEVVGSGGFALAVAVEEAVLAAVASQPSAPFPVGARRAADPGMSAAELDRVAERAAAGEVCALGMRFSEDRASSRQRFAGLKARLGDAFEIIELDSSPGNPDGFSAHAHSVITSEVREGNSAHAARERVVAFLGERLRTR